MAVDAAARVMLRPILTQADRASVMHLRRGPGQEAYLGSMASHFEDAEADPQAMPRMWAVHDADAPDLVVGFAMISNGIPAATLAEDAELVGPYFLWRLLIDEAWQGRGYGRATIDAIVEYLRVRPDAEVLWTSCKDGAGSPQPFYLRYGFEKTGTVKWGEDLLRLDLATRGLPPQAPDGERA